MENELFESTFKHRINENEFEIMTLIDVCKFEDKETLNRFRNELISDSDTHLGQFIEKGLYLGIYSSVKIIIE